MMAAFGRPGGLVRRRADLVWGVGLAVVLSACDTGREQTLVEPVPVTAENVAAAVLTVEDLPPGFTRAEGAGTPISAQVLPEHACDDALANLVPEESSSADFVGSGTTLTSTVAWFPGAGAAVDQLFADVSSACAQVVATDAGVAIRSGALSFGVLSDDTIALAFEVEAPGTPIVERDLILRREGDLVHLLRLTGARPSDKTLLDESVRAAIGRLSALALETGQAT